MENSPAPAPQRNTHLDAFRGVAIVAVMMFHYLVRWAPPFHTSNITNLEGEYSPYWQIGKYGVQLFFVISGIVIGMTIVKSNNPLDFMIKRASRLYPAFVVATIVTFVTMKLFGVSEFAVDWRDLFLTMTMFGVKLGADLVDGAYWSLTIEVIFYGYVLLSWIMWKSTFWYGMIILMAASIAFDHLSGGLLGVYMPFFLAGIGIYMVRDNNIRNAIVVFSFCAFGFIYNWEHYNLLQIQDGIPQASIIIATIALGVLFVINPSFNVPPLSFIGRISYSVYLIHQNIGVTIISHIKRVGAPDAAALAITIGIIIFCGWLMYMYVEVPAQKMILKLSQPLRAYGFIAKKSAPAATHS